MGDEFISGYANLVDGEKDPRNLLLAFSIDRVICIEFDISRHVEVRPTWRLFIPITYQCPRQCSTLFSVISPLRSNLPPMTPTELLLMISEPH